MFSQGTTTSEVLLFPGHSSMDDSSHGHAAIFRGRQCGRGPSGGTHSSQNRSAVSRATKRAPSPDFHSVLSTLNEGVEEEESIRKKQKLQRTWVHEDMTQEIPIFPEGSYAKYRDMLPLQLIELILGYDVYTLRIDWY